MLYLELFRTCSDMLQYQCCYLCVFYWLVTITETVPSNAAHHWSFDEAETIFQIQDEVTRKSATFKGDGASLTTISTNTRVNNYLSLKGRSVLINLGSFTDCIGNISSCNNGFTLSLWLRLKDIASFQHLIGSSSKSTPGWSLTQENNQMNFTVSFGSKLSSVSYKCKPLIWYQHTITWQREMLLVYMNGKKIRNAKYYTVESPKQPFYSSLLSLTLDNIQMEPSCNVTSSSSVCVKWINREDLYESIHSEFLQYKINTMDELHRVNIGLYQHEKCLTNLEPLSEYEVTAVTMLNDGEKRLSNTVTCKTINGVPAPPMKLTITANDSKTAYVTWEKPQPSIGHIERYEITLFTVSEKKERIGQYNISSIGMTITVTLRSLTPGTKYMVDVESIGKLGRTKSTSNIARTYAKMMKNLSAVEGFKVTSITDRSIVLSWNDIFSKFSSQVIYRVFYRTQNGSNMSVDTKDMKVELRNLQAATVYSLNIKAFTKEKEGEMLKNNLVIVTQDKNECLYPMDNVCDTLAECINTKESYLCRCPKGYVGNGRLCRKIPKFTTETYFCGEETYRNIKWPSTYSGGEAIVECPQGVFGFAIRKCREASKSSHAIYNQPDLSNCVSSEIAEIETMVNNKETSGIDAITKLADITKSLQLYGGDIRRSMEYAHIILMNKFPRNIKSKAKVMGKEMTSMTSNLLANTSISAWYDIPQDNRKDIAEELMMTIETTANLIIETIHEKFETKETNIELKVETDSSDASFTSYDQNKTGYEIKLPTQDLNALGLSNTSLIFVKYDNIGAFLTPTIQSVSPSVISASVSNQKVEFKSPVIITVPHPPNYKVSSPSCVFWNASARNGYGSWSSNGCHVNQSTKEHTICYCYHLTSFAVLMTLTEDAANTLINTGHEFSLKLITYIGLTISIIALSIALITFSCFRFLKSTRTIFHRYLVLSLLMASIIFLAGIQSTKNKVVCQVVAILLEYFYLVSFVWMALEGVLLYFMLRKVFKDRKFFKRKLFHALCWALPAVYVGAFYIAYPHHYGTKHYCWLSVQDGFIWTFIAPVLAVIAFNVFVVVLAFRIMAERYREKGDEKVFQIWYWIKGCFVLMFLLGITWVFGLLHVNSSSIMFAYIFSILNALQGLFIFIFHCLIDPTVRSEYARLLKCEPRSKYNEKVGYSSSMRYRKLSSSVVNGSSEKRKFNTSTSDTLTNKNDSYADKHSQHYYNGVYIPTDDKKPLLERRITFEEDDDVFTSKEELKIIEYQPPPYHVTEKTADEYNIQNDSMNVQKKSAKQPQRDSALFTEVILQPEESAVEWRSSLFDELNDDVEEIDDTTELEMFSRYLSQGEVIVNTYDSIDDLPNKLPPTEEISTTTKPFAQIPIVEEDEIVTVQNTTEVESARDDFNFSVLDELDEREIAIIEVRRDEVDLDELLAQDFEQSRTPERKSCYIDINPDEKNELEFLLDSLMNSNSMDLLDGDTDRDSEQYDSNDGTQNESSDGEQDESNEEIIDDNKDESRSKDTHVAIDKEITLLIPKHDLEETQEDDDITRKSDVTMVVDNEDSDGELFVNDNLNLTIILPNDAPDESNSGGEYINGGEHNGDENESQFVQSVDDIDGVVNVTIVLSDDEHVDDGEETMPSGNKEVPQNEEEIDSLGNNKKIAAKNEENTKGKDQTAHGTFDLEIELSKSDDDKKISLKDEVQAKNIRLTIDIPNEDCVSVDIVKKEEDREVTEEEEKEEEEGEEEEEEKEEETKENKEYTQPVKYIKKEIQPDIEEEKSNEQDKKEDESKKQEEEEEEEEEEETLKENGEKKKEDEDNVGLEKNEEVKINAKKTEDQPEKKTENHCEDLPKNENKIEVDKNKKSNEKNEENPFSDKGIEMTEALRQSELILSGFMEDTRDDNNKRSSIKDRMSKQQQNTLPRKPRPLNVAQMTSPEDEADNRMSIPSTIIYEINDLIAAIPPKMEAISPKPRKRIRTNRRLQSEEGTCQNDSDGSYETIENIDAHDDLFRSLEADGKHAETLPLIDANDMFKSVDEEIEKDNENIAIKAKTPKETSPAVSLHPNETSPTFRSHIEIIQIRPGESIIGRQEDELIESPSLQTNHLFQYEVE